MQRSAPVAPTMTPITRDDLNRLIQEYGPLKDQLDQAKLAAQGQPGGWQRSVAPTTSVAVTRKVEEIQRQLNADIDAVERLYEAHSAYIQDLVDTAKGTMAGAKKAVESYEKLQDEDSLQQAVHVTNIAADSLEATAAAAVNADRDYGAAWFQYRANLGPLPEGVSQDYFDSKRKDVMARAKITTAKVEKLKQLTVQAKAYDELSKKLLVGGKKKKEEVKAAATALTDKMQDLLDKGIEKRTFMGWDGDGRNWKSKEKALETMAKGKITKKTQEEAATWLANLEAAAKSVRNQVKTMDTVLATGLKAFTPKQIKSQQKLFALAEAPLDRAKAILKEGEEILVDARKHMAVIKKAKV
jgi:hypothetical protein